MIFLTDISFYFPQVRSLVLLLLAMGLVGCGLVSQDQQAASNEVIVDEGNRALSAFQSGMHSITLSSCSSCHGQSQFPMFAVSDPEMAYQTTISLVNFDLVDRSKLLIKAGDGHCGSNCMSKQDQVREAIIAWGRILEEESQDPSGGDPDVVLPDPEPDRGLKFDFLSLKVAVPESLSEQGTQLVWNLGHLGADFEGVVFKAKLQIFDDFTYQISELKLTTQSEVIAIDRIGFGLNEYFRVEDNAYFLTSPRINLNQNNATVSNTPMIFLMDKGPGQDELQVGFGSLLATVGCTSQSEFTQKVYPILTSSCTSCHDSGHALDLSGNAQDACFNFIQTVNFANPLQSNAIQRPLGVGHSRRFNSGSTQAQAIESWIQSETNR